MTALKISSHLKLLVLIPKNLYFSLIGILLTSVLISCNKDIVGNQKLKAVYSDIRYTPIDSISTTPYVSPQIRSNQDASLALGIAISGGGSRAQYFSTGVLIGLDEIKKEGSTSSFLNEIDYYSTVSGGGFGAGYYLTLKKFSILDDFTDYFDYWKSTTRKDNLQEFLYADAEIKSALKLRKYERNKLKRTYIKVINEELLQAKKSYITKNSKKIDFRELLLSDFFETTNELKSPDPNKIMPMFVPNGTIYNNGEKIPFMPHILKSLNIAGSLTPEEPFKNFDGYNFPLKYAIAGSAAFPGLLPMLKLNLSGGDKSVIRIIDGGAVDNLGYSTLLGLLKLDNSVTKKRALIVNCGGQGNLSRTLPNDTLKLIPLVIKSLLYTVDINILNAENNIKLIATPNNIKPLVIGFKSIKEKLLALETAASGTATMDQITTIKQRIIDQKETWNTLYKPFSEDMRTNFSINAIELLKKKPGKKVATIRVSEIATEDFQNFTLLQIFNMFELASHVDTKIKIGPDEKEVLVLAGRYAVYLERERIKDLLK